MKYQIEIVSNGYILKSLDFECHSYIYEDFHDVLQHLIDNIQPGSRYDDERLYLVKAPGDKNEKFTDNHYKIIFGEI